MSLRMRRFGLAADNRATLGHGNTASIRIVHGRREAGCHLRDFVLGLRSAPRAVSPTA